MRKGIIILLSVALMVSVAGCGSGKELKSEYLDAQSKKVVSENVTKKPESTKKPDKLQDASETPAKAVIEPLATSITEEILTPQPDISDVPKENIVETPKRQDTLEEKAEVVETSVQEDYEMDVLQEVEEQPVQEEIQADISQEQISEEQPQPVIQSVSYSPQNVVAIATSKIKAGGKEIIPEEMNRMLAEGTISQDIYDMFYPYDGAGYYSVFVETDLNKATTTSGRRLCSEDEIAQYIADMMLLERVSSVAVEYAGVSNGQFYEFRCYR